MMMVRAFTTSMKIIAIEPSANPLEQMSSDQCVNFAAFVPYQIQNILGSKHPQLLNNVDKLIIGGAPLDQETSQQLVGYRSECYATYGMTETISHIALQRLNGRTAQNYFQTLPGVTIQLDDRGCLVIKSPHLHDVVVTNDIAEMCGPGRFRISGRVDNVINSGGVKIFAEKTEAAIQTILKKVGIHGKFFLYGFPDKLLGQKLAMIVEADSDIERRAQNIFSFLSQELSPYEIPKVLIVIPSFILTETGKINRLQSSNQRQRTISLK
jgi:O-succinylbenzoic acid--CoA ligase